MRKRTLLLIVVIIAAIAVTGAYLVMEDWRPAIGDTVASAQNFVTGQFMAFSDWFQTLPSWPAIGIGLGVLGGILFDRYCQDIWHGLQSWGLQKRMEDVYPTSRPQQTELPQSVAVPPPAAAAPPLTDQEQTAQ